MSNQRQTAQKPIADAAMTRGYLVVTNIEKIADEVIYTFLADNGGITQLTGEAKWFDCVDDAVDVIYKQGIKPKYHNGALFPKVVKACERLVVEQVAYECVVSGEEVEI